MNPSKKYEITRLKGNLSQEEEDIVIVEYPLTIFLNGRELLTLLCSPISIRALVLGFLFSDGQIDSLSDIEILDIDEEKGQAHVYLKEDRCSVREEGRLIASSSAKGTAYFQILDSLKEKKLVQRKEVDYDLIRALMVDFNNRSLLFKKTGGTHSAGLLKEDEREFIYFEEDIGRHNAIDKILGKSLDQALDLTDKIVFTSGRISSEIIIKLAKRHIPVIISMSAPTSMAIELARDLNIRLLGFVRGNKLNIYN